METTTTETPTTTESTPTPEAISVRSSEAKMIRLAAMQAAAKVAPRGEDGKPVEITRSNWQDYLPDAEYKAFMLRIKEADLKAQEELEKAGKVVKIASPTEDSDSQEKTVVVAERKCADCDTVLIPTGKRGRPAVTCEDCKAKRQVAKKAKTANLCLVCGEEIPPTGKRGRPASMHEQCKAELQEWVSAVAAAEKAAKKAEKEAQPAQEDEVIEIIEPVFSGFMSEIPVDFTGVI